MSSSATVSTGQIYQLKITLREIRPPIWRRIQVPGVITLHELHLIIQEVMSWWNYHLHQFIIDGVYYTEPDPDASPEDVDERKAILAKTVRREKENSSTNMISAMIGCMMCWLKRSSILNRASSIRYSARESGYVPPRTAAVPRDTIICWRLLVIPIIRSTKSCWSGSAANTILKPLISTKSMRT